MCRCADDEEKLSYAEVYALNRRAFGIWGEEYIAKLLEGQGYEILERNWRYSNVGEIDIIAQVPGDSSNPLIFVEVKTRRSVYRGTPIEAVDRRKYYQIRKIAGAYLDTLDHYTKDVRIDIYGILVQNGKIDIKSVKGARFWY